nr:MucBP domain-containing protein [Furfurilactobacillus milii]
MPKIETTTVNYYLVNTANVLAPSTTLTGDYGTSQTADAAAIAGYTALSNTQVVNFTNDTSAVNFYYQPEDAATITVNDVLTDGTIISTRTLPAGKYGQAYTTSADALTGYVWNQATPANATGTYSLTPQTVTYTYDRENGQPVTVNYVVNGTTKVLGTTQLTGHYGDTVTAQTAAFSNYTLVGTPAQTTTTLTDRPQTMTFLYDDTGNRYVNVSYVRRVTVNGQQELLTMAPSAVTTVEYNSQYTTAPVNITGYYVSATSVAGPANGSWSDLSTDSAKNQVVYYYNADPESFKVTYTDLQGNDLFSQTPVNTIQLVNAYYGLGYSFTAPAIAGYTLVSDATVKGTVGLDPSDIHFIYAKDQTVTTHYVDNNGNVIATPVSQTLTYGGTYTTQPATVSGYTLVATPANASGQYDRTNTANSVDVTYVYQKVSTSETPTSGPSTSTSPSQAPSAVSTPASGVSTSTSVVTSQTSTPTSGMSVTPSQDLATSMPSTPNQGTETVPPRVVPVAPVSTSPVIPVVTPTGNRATNETPANEAGTPIARQMTGDPTPLQSNAVSIAGGSQSTRTTVDEPSWDPIKLVLMDVDGHIIAVHEVSGYTGTWVYIGDLIPAGYHLAPGQSAWLLLNDVSPQTLRLVKDSDGTMVAATSASTLAKNQTPPTAQTVAGSDTQTAAKGTMSRAAAHSAASQNLLPHTNEGQQSWLQALGLGLLAMLFGLLGLFSWRKRRHNVDDNQDSDI